MVTSPRSPLATDNQSLLGVGASGQGNTTGQSFVIDVNEDRDFGQEFDAVRKKKKRSKGKKKGKNAASGFEENFADAPLTPEEAKEENEDLYSPWVIPKSDLVSSTLTLGNYSSRSFAERIEFCIQRYRARRKFDSERKDMFDKYLVLGGIESGPKAFSNGIDAGNPGDNTAEDIAALGATDYVGGDKVSAGAEGSEWVVDFEGIAKCFFSSRVPQTYDIDIERNIPLCTSLVKNFLNYILYHNVCPEYAEQVEAARKICDLAVEELSSIKELSQTMPGDFNVACSTIYGGYYQGMYSGNQDWADGIDLTCGMDDARAKQVVMTAISALGTDEQFEQAQREIVIINNEELGIEVTGIELATDETRAFYENSLGGALKTMGKLLVKSWDHPFAPPEDMSDDGQAEDQDRAFQERTFEFWVEEDLLHRCFVGLKAIVNVRTLNCGINYFDTVSSLYCSFFTPLTQEAMMVWRKPEAMRPRGEMLDDDADGAQEGDNGGENRGILGEDDEF
ncbi:MAG: hypothetical protein M4579_004937 [Chaenotheca gracillima]|nr:MAG: hypothetical protein M4579_004937 [Chaenotheca gracillima]